MATSHPTNNQLPTRVLSYPDDWKLDDPDPHKMAIAGFMYKGPGDLVECYACGVNLSDWKKGQDPMLRHVQAVDWCIVTHERHTLDDDGISIGNSDSTQSTISLGRTSRSSGDSGYDEGLPRRMQPYLTPIDSSGNSTAITLRDNPVPTRSRRPRSPAPSRYKQLDERIKSFYGVDWQPGLEATPDKLSKAGFYYVGPADRVKCAYCFGKLKKWRPTDVAIEEHVHFFPDCTFVKNIEEQTAVLAKNIRSKQKNNNCITSEALIREYEMQRELKKRANPEDIAMKTLKKMNYSNSDIRQAKRRLREKNIPVSLENYITELQQLTKEAFFGSTSSGIASADEEFFSDEEETPAVAETVEETTRRLEQELRIVEQEREEYIRQTTCKVCLASRIDTLFLTCRHFVTCKDCADRVRDCPLCRKVILGTVDVFML